MKLNTPVRGARQRRFRAGAGRVAQRRSITSIAVALSLVAVLAGCAFPPSRSGSGVGTTEIVRHAASPGETLASIADDYYGTIDAAAYLADVNGVAEDSTLDPGAVVEVPVGPDDIERYRRRTEAKILYNRGTLFAGGGDYVKAQDEFALALRADPRFVDAGYNLAVVLLATGEFERAAAALEQVMAIRPDEPLFEFALGKAHFDAGRVPVALEHFDRAVALDPSLEDARFARAVALLELGQRDEAIFALDLYVREFPEGAWAESARVELEKLARESGGTAP